MVHVVVAWWRHPWLFCFVLILTQLTGEVAHASVISFVAVFVLGGWGGV
jgi:hypothetical protein